MTKLQRQEMKIIKNKIEECKKCEKGKKEKGKIKETIKGKVQIRKR